MVFRCIEGEAVKRVLFVVALAVVLSACAHVERAAQWSWHGCERAERWRGWTSETYCANARLHVGKWTD